MSLDGFPIVYPVLRTFLYSILIGHILRVLNGAEVICLPDDQFDFVVSFAIYVVKICRKIGKTGFRWHRCQPALLL